MNARTFEVVKTTGGDDSLELRRCSARLRTYTGEPIPVEGEFSAVIHYGEQHLELPVVVVDTAGPNLLGRDWMKFLQLDWQTIKQVRGDPGRGQSIGAELQKKYRDVFSADLGCLKDVEVKFDVNEDAKPCFYRPRNIPYAFRKRVEEQLDAEVEAGVLEPVRTADWACQIVPIVKPDA
ncbi:uncharacterized protein K02A2.6-like isoform X1 [Amphibalanus amphitrite]|uniref:uncharacterized protein K02A2.6-like isoform X1 n=1 Tax=Amphibalanus amphitrite TaxID=1232801 RepID=UPI001C919515|nr:uncharacterized protein K02A2.6-like isoform X1 [Amphibalanus amphitrite]